MLLSICYMECIALSFWQWAKVDIKITLKKRLPPNTQPVKTTTNTQTNKWTLPNTLSPCFVVNNKPSIVLHEVIRKLQSPMKIYSLRPKVNVTIRLYVCRGIYCWNTWIAHIKPFSKRPDPVKIHEILISSKTAIGNPSWEIKAKLLQMHYYCRIGTDIMFGSVCFCIRPSACPDSPVWSWFVA